MTELVAFIQSHVEYAPFIIFGLLLLAGFNIPISEDGMLFITASLAAKNPEYLPQLFAGVYFGAYFSDFNLLQPRPNRWTKITSYQVFCPHGEAGSNR